MNGQFRLDFEPMFREHGTAVERATLAELAITVDHVVVTRLEDILAKTVRHQARVSTYRLACWFAANWWRLRWEPERASLSWKMSHQLGTVGGGYVWPDLSLSSDGSTMLVRSRNTSDTPIHPIRYLDHHDLIVPAGAFEAGTELFIEAVMARLASHSVGESELSVLWKEVQEERRDPESASWRKLEALLGFDPDEGAPELIERLKGAQGAHGESAIEELAAASMGEAPEQLDALLAVKRRDLPQFSVADFASLRQAISQAGDPSMYPWLRADKAAAIARNTWGITSGPVPTVRLAELFDIPEDRLLQPESHNDVGMPVGFRDEHDERTRVFLAKRHPTSRRFALARLVGDQLAVGPGERLLPATGARTARQKFQRAFAQEFLCPFADLREFLGEEAPSDELIEDAASHFDVSPLVITTTLVNKGLLDRAILQA